MLEDIHEKALLTSNDIWRKKLLGCGQLRKKNIFDAEYNGVFIALYEFLPNPARYEEIGKNCNDFCREMFFL